MPHGLWSSEPMTRFPNALPATPKSTWKYCSVLRGSPAEDSMKRHNTDQGWHIGRTGHSYEVQEASR